MRMIQAWQAKWHTTDNRRWIHQLTSNDESWYKRKHVLKDFLLTQVLTGHGCFASYLKRFGRRSLAPCWFFIDIIGDIVHTIFKCDAWVENRSRCCTIVCEDINQQSIVRIMLERKSNLDAVHTYINDVIKAKKDEEGRQEREDFIL